MNPFSSRGTACEPQALAWPPLGPPQGEEAGVSAANPLALKVCDTLERRLERLAAHALPRDVAEDVIEMWRDLATAQGLLAATWDGAGARRAQRLLADLQAWLPVCETWIGRAGEPPAAWPALN